MTVPTPLYLALMLEIERHRHACHIPMDEMSARMGGAERGYAKMLYPETRSGRCAGWATMQRAIDVLFAEGFTLALERAYGPMLSTPSMRRRVKESAHWFDRATFAEVMRERAATGGLVRAKRLGKRQRIKIARRAAKVRWRRARIGKE